VYVAGSAGLRDELQLLLRAPSGVSVRWMLELWEEAKGAAGFASRAAPHPAHLGLVAGQTKAFCDIW